jgi:predicted ATPase
MSLAVPWQEIAMLNRLHVTNFKSLANVTVELPRFSVLFGPNAVGKSNFLDAVQALSRIGTLRTLSDALSEPIRGYPIEAFAFPPEGLQGLLNSPRPSFTLEADLTAGRDSYRYRAEVAIKPESGSLSLQDEYLAQLTSRGEPKGRPSIEMVGDALHIRRKSKPAHPRQEPIGANHSLLSDPRLGGNEYKAIERVRQEMSGWRTYYLDPRVAMRAARTPSAVQDIGVLGGEIAPYLYRLQEEYPKYYQSISRTLRTLVPNVEHMTIDLDKRRGTLDILIRQDGIDYSSRIVSEGTLRVLALCAIAVNPWGGSLLAFEEPENGVHPRRLELIASLLLSLAMDWKTQVMVTTHSPLFCDAVLKRARSHPGEIGLFNVRRCGQATAIHPFDVTGPLFQDAEVAKALSEGTEDGLFENLLLRGLLDE